jgi:hypothetical protein
VYFQELQRKLIDLARERVRAGEVTERGLAKICAISQSHMHNVLKNVRGFSTDSADRLMKALDLRVPDLLWRVPDVIDSDIQAIPIVRNRIGPGTDAVLSTFRGHIPMPDWLLKDAIDPVVARLGPDLVMPRALSAHDLVLLDQSPAARADPQPASLWVVADGAGLRVRYIRRPGGQLHVADELTLDDPHKWRFVPLQGRNILDVVRARIVWISREMEAEPAGPAVPAR